MYNEQYLYVHFRQPRTCLPHLWFITKATRVALLEKELFTLPMHVQPRFSVGCMRSCFSKPRKTVALLKMYIVLKLIAIKCGLRRGVNPPSQKKTCKKSASDRQLLTWICYLHYLVANVYNGFIRGFDTLKVDLSYPLMMCPMLFLSTYLIITIAAFSYVYILSIARRQLFVIFLQIVKNKNCVYTYAN